MHLKKQDIVALFGKPFVYPFIKNTQDNEEVRVVVINFSHLSNQAILLA